MKVSAERLENCEVLLTIEVENERVEKALREAARKVSQTVDIPGFRRGKAPYPIVLRMFGREALLREALDDLGEAVLKEALEETKITPYAEAEWADVQLDPLVLKLRVPVAPVVDLGDYRRLRLDVPIVEVTEEELNKALESLREENAYWTPVTRGAAWGDRVTITIRKDGADASETSKPVDMELHQDKAFPIPEFGQNLLGAVAGESRTFSITFPEHWPVETEAGQTITVHVEVQEVKEKELPPLEELPALVGDYEDLEALKAGLRQQLAAQQEEQNDEKLLEKALDILTEQATVEYPKVLLDEELERYLRQQDVALRQQGLDLENYLKVLKVTREQYKEQRRPEVAKRLRRELVLSRLAELERLQVDAEEIKEEIESRAEDFEEVSEEMPDKVRNLLHTPEGVRYVVSEILMDKARQRLLEIVKGQAPELTPAETAPAGAASEAAEAGEEGAAPSESESIPSASESVSENVPENVSENASEMDNASLDKN